MAKTIQCHKVYKFRMEPTELQGLELSRAAAVARFVYNWALERCQRHYKQHKRGKPWNELSAELTQLKKTEPWLYDFDAQMLGWWYEPETLGGSQHCGMKRERIPRR